MIDHGALLRNPFAVFALLSIACARPAFATLIDPGIERFTTVTFGNAPESISQVVSAHRVSAERVSLEVKPGACWTRHSRGYVMLVSDGGMSRFRPKAFVMTGALQIDGRLTPVIRTISQHELSAMGCELVH